MSRLREAWVRAKSLYTDRHLIPAIRGPLEKAGILTPLPSWEQRDQVKENKLPGSVPNVPAFKMRSYPAPGSDDPNWHFPPDDQRQKELKNQQILVQLLRTKEG